MKFLVFTDVHEDSKIIKDVAIRAAKPDIEFVICLGDFSNFGRGIKNVLTKFDKLGKPFYFIPGNHEEGINFDHILKAYSNCVNLHEKDIQLGDYIFLCHGTGGFAQEDAEFRKLARKWYGKYQGRKIIFLTHGPPYNTNLDKLSMGHVGHKDYHKFIRRIKPKLALSGHLHETFGEQDMILETKLLNVGPDGMVIDLP